MDFLTTKEVAELLGVTAVTLSNWRKKNCGPPTYRIGGEVRYEREDLERWLEEQRSDNASVKNK